MNKGVKIALGIIGGFLLFMVITAFAMYSWVNGMRDTGIQHEKTLTAQYLDNQNYLSTYISGFYEQVGVAQAQGEALNDILLDAVKGRYDEGGYSVSSPLFNVIMEAYPEASLEQLLENWGKIQDYITAQREGYRNVQSKLLDMLREYDTWRRTGIVKSNAVRMLGFPGGDLEARIGETVLTGEVARNKMYQIVLTGAALDAYESGTLDPLKVPSSSE